MNLKGCTRLLCPWNLTTTLLSDSADFGVSYPGRFSGFQIILLTAPSHKASYRLSENSSLKAAGEEIILKYISDRQRSEIIFLKAHTLQ
jgi:hypothetical protein